MRFPQRTSAHSYPCGDGAYTGAGLSESDRLQGGTSTGSPSGSDRTGGPVGGGPSRSVPEAVAACSSTKRRDKPCLMVIQVSRNYNFCLPPCGNVLPSQT